MIAANAANDTLKLASIPLLLSYEFPWKSLTFARLKFSPRWPAHAPHWSRQAPLRRWRSGMVPRRRSSSAR